MIDIEKLQELSHEHDTNCEGWGDFGPHGSDVDPDQCTCQCRAIYEACLELQAARETTTILRAANKVLGEQRDLQAEELELLRGMQDSYVNADACESYWVSLYYQNKAYEEWRAKQEWDEMKKEKMEYDARELVRDLRINTKLSE